jgi:diguanylate cyclase (GGDEF)-like protein/PAS domain S-box-containing protein
VYWDLVLDDQRPRAMAQAVPLLELMRQAGFTEQEFAKLADAKANSDALTHTEFDAMALIESAESAESADTSTDANRVRALLMLHDAAYHQAKANIMRPISQFQQMADQRTAAAVHDAETNAVWMRLAVILFGMMLVFLLWKAWRTLSATLGGSPKELHRRISDLGSGDLLSAPIPEGMQNSVLGWLSATQVRLAKIDAGRKMAEQSLAAREAWYRSIFENANTGIASADSSGRLTSFNEAFRAMLGYDAEALRHMNFADFTHPDDLNLEVNYFNKILDGKREHYRITKRYFASDGRLLWVDLSVSLIGDARGKEANFLGVIQDITERKRTEEELRIAAAAFESQEAIMITDPDGVILRVNRAFADSTGYTAEEVIGRKPSLLKSGRHDAAFYAAMWDSLIEAGTWQGEIWDRRKDGAVYPKWLAISAVKGDDGVVTHYVGTHQDITERKNAEEKIAELVNFDSLTHLPNRTLLVDRLKQAMTISARTDTCATLLFIDLDNFKMLNDTLGHDKGDLLLREVAQRLVAIVREVDTVARVGGDEFVVVLGSLSGSPQEAAIQTEAIGEKILAALNAPYSLGDIEYHNTASIGATVFKGHQTSIDDLLKQADLAMYKSKETGRNAMRFFDPVMQTLAMERAALETSLRKAIEGGQFLLYYQPQVVGGDRVTGAEALVRWQHPERGLVPPSDFIPLAEETGLILPLGDWVLKTACVQLALWKNRTEFADLTIAVNVSAQQFRDPGFVDKVLSVISHTGANPNRLKLELTESLLVDNVQDIIAKMYALKARGVGFSLDDFGTGYSSLAYLKRMPLDQLKIDRSFVRDVLVDPNDAAIAKTIVALAQSLGLGVIAEGVETESQRDFLADAGCHCYQGYFFSRPLPIDDFEQFAQRI